MLTNIKEEKLYNSAVKEIIKEYNIVNIKMLQYSIDLTSCDTELLLIKLKLCSLQLQIYLLEEMYEEILYIKQVMLETHILLMYIDRKCDVIARPIPPLID